MLPEAGQFCLSDGNREALIIRWRTILMLGLQDFFTNESRDFKIIVREILDMFEGVLKAFAESLGINVRNRGFIEIFNGIKGNDQVPIVKRKRLEEINNSLSANELNSIRNLVRNPEAHSLNLPSIPIESAIRCWRLFNEVVTICDDSLITYAQSRPEFKEFCNLHTFFYKFVINSEYVDLRTIKQFEMSVRGRTQGGKIKEVEILHERTISEIIQFISERSW